MNKILNTMFARISQTDLKKEAERLIYNEENKHYIEIFNDGFNSFMDSSPTNNPYKTSTVPTVESMAW